MQHDLYSILVGTSSRESREEFLTSDSSCSTPIMHVDWHVDLMTLYLIVSEFLTRIIMIIARHATIDYSDPLPHHKFPNSLPV